MILNNKEIIKLLKNNIIIGADPSKVNSSSLDVHLDNKFVLEDSLGTLTVIDLKDRTSLIQHHAIQTSGYYLYPKQFVLAQTLEKFDLPLNISARFSLNSNLARRGLLHSDADWLEAGWINSHLTLELYNMLNNHVLYLEKGLAIGKIVFYKHEEVAEADSYRRKGSYNNQNEVRQ